MRLYGFSRYNVCIFIIQIYIQLILFSFFHTYICVVGVHAGMCACSLVYKHTCMGVTHMSMQVPGVV